MEFKETDLIRNVKIQIISILLDNIILSKTSDTVLSIGCGSGHLENILTEYVKHVDAIDKIYRFNKKLKNNKLKFNVVDFLSYKFTKKYNLLVFSNSLQFILNEHPSKIDKDYLKFVENKIHSLLKQNGHIFIYTTMKKWFLKNKRTVSKLFLESLNNSLKIISLMNFKIVDDFYINDKFHRIMILRNT